VDEFPKYPRPGLAQKVRCYVEIEVSPSSIGRGLGRGLAT
jgi:hypothetical protein